MPNGVRIFLFSDPTSLRTGHDFAATHALPTASLGKIDKRMLTHEPRAVEETAPVTALKAAEGLQSLMRERLPKALAPGPLEQLWEDPSLYPVLALVPGLGDCRPQLCEGQR